MSALDDWQRQAIDALGLGEDVFGHATEVLDVARDVAHQVMRPAAPLSAYLMGVAVGRGADPGTVAATLTALAAKWSGEEGSTA